jgi:hypothetical protein
MKELVELKEAIEREVGSITEIKGQFRTDDLVMYRTVYYLIAREFVIEGKEFSYSKIGAVVGKGHASVLHSVKKNRDRVFNTPHYANLYSSVRAMFIDKLDSVESAGREEIRSAIRIYKQASFLMEENQRLKNSIDTLKRADEKLYNLFYGLSEEQVDIVMDKLQLLVKTLR